MRRRTRNAGFVMSVLLILSWILGACGTSPSGGISTPLPAKTPNTSVISSTTPVNSSIEEDFSGMANLVDYIDLMSRGGQLKAFTTDGNSTQKPTFILCFKGPVINNAVDLNSVPCPAVYGTEQVEVPVINNEAHLVAHLTVQAALGTITLKDGKFFSFEVQVIKDPPIPPGLYIGEQTVAGVRYLAGWVVLPSTIVTPTQTLTPLSTPSSTPSPTPTLTLSPAPSSTPSLTPTLTPSPAPTLTPTATTSPGLQGQGEGVINEQTGALSLAPALGVQDIASKQVLVPGLGIFPLTLFRMGEPVAIPSIFLSTN